MSDSESRGQQSRASAALADFQDETELSESLGGLQLRERHNEGRWSRGVGRLVEGGRTPPGVTTTRPRRKESAWLQEPREDLLVAQAYQLLREAEEIRRSRESYGASIISGRDDLQENPIENARGEEEGVREERGGTAQNFEIPVRGVEPQEAQPRQIPNPRRKRPKIPPLTGKYDGNPKTLGLFLAQVWNHMEDWGQEYLSEAAQVRGVTNALEGAAATWMVVLHNNDSPLLKNYNQFMAALRRRFEDHLAERKARIRMKGIQQGRRSVADYVQEFRELTPYMTGWSEAALLENFKDGLNEEIYRDCRARGIPDDLHDWYVMAEDVEIEIARSRLRGRESREQPPTYYRREAPRIPGGRTDFKPKAKAFICFKCGREGHRATECVTKPIPRGPAPTTKKSEREVAKPRVSVLKGGIVDFAPRNQKKMEPPTTVEDSDEDSDTEDVVSENENLLLIPIELRVPSTGTYARIRALIDSGCARCVISPQVAKEMKLNLKLLKRPLAFCQLDGTMSGGDPAKFITERLELQTGDHVETLKFVVAPGMERPLILGLPWLQKWNPRINWRTGVVRIRIQRQLSEGVVTSPDSGRDLTKTEVALCHIEGEEKIPREYWDLREVFSEEASSALPPHRSTDCAIEILPGVKLPKPKIYPMSPRELEEMRKFVDKNLQRGFIEPARPRVAAPVMFREKKDGSFRLVVDYRNLNAICVENVYPLPLMKDMLTHLGKGKIFTKLDLREAYYRVRIKEGDEWKTAFNCSLGCFQFRVLPFGLQGAPAVFMQLINQVLHDHLYKGVLVYLDDILIYSECLNDHVKLVRTVLKKLRAAELYAKLSKCEFHQTRIDYLGYRISPEGIEMDPGKVQAVLEWAAPKTRKQLQSFLGFANFYRQFIPSFASIALPLTNLLKTKKDGKPRPSQPLEWTMSCQAAFEKLKRLFAAEPVLKHPVMDELFIVQADASDAAVGAVLLQTNADGQLQPCAYTSRKFSDTERRWAIWEKEAFAVRWALLTWRQFLEGTNLPFEVWTDHKNLEALKTPRKLSPKQARWAQHFGRFNFNLRYLPGGRNFLADALSRMPQFNSSRLETVLPIIPSTQLAAPVTTRAQSNPTTDLTCSLVQELRDSLKDDKWFQERSNECTLRDGLAWVGAKLYVPCSLRGKVLERAHDARTAGHFGFVKTLHLIKRQFWWPALKRDIENYVASCPVCASAKRPPGKTPGLLQNVARPTAPWKEISMDFIVDLPPSEGCTVIWVVTDLFSKQVHFIPCTKIPSAKSLATMFVRHIYRLHGAPTRIISDRGVQFTSLFWREFLTLIGSAQGLSSAHHPQTNGACERTNGVLEQYLRCYVNYQQDDWVGLLPFAEVAYNNSVHSSTGFTPFQVVSGQDFVPIPELSKIEPSCPTLAEWLERLRGTWAITRKALDEAHRAHKDQADKKRRPAPKYDVGDKVFLSTKYLHSTQKSKKLGPKYVGPFPITRLINSVTVELLLPKNLRRVHPVFHVSLLKPAVSSPFRSVSDSSPPVPILIDGEQHFEVKSILDSRKHHGKVQYLVAWKHFPLSHAEWVYETDIKAPGKIRSFHAKYPDKL